MREKYALLMYLMYVDESGDPGLSAHSSPHFILSGLIIHQDNWQVSLDRFKEFRKYLKKSYGLNQRQEIHAAELIRVSKLDAYRKITKTKRLSILKECSNQLPVIFDTAKILNIFINKSEFMGNDVFVTAWSRLLQRYSTFLKKAGNNDKGLLITDDTDSIKLQQLQRKMRVYNPVPSMFGGSGRNLPIDNIIEDPFSRSSNASYFIQGADIAAHLLYRKEFVKGSLRKFGVERYFYNLDTVLLKEANKADPLGIVRR